MPLTWSGPPPSPHVRWEPAGLSRPPGRRGLPAPFDCMAGAGWEGTVISCAWSGGFRSSGAARRSCGSCLAAARTWRPFPSFPDSSALMPCKGEPQPGEVVFLSCSEQWLVGREREGPQMSGSPVLFDKETNCLFAYIYKGSVTKKLNLSFTLSLMRRGEDIACTGRLCVCVCVKE